MIALQTSDSRENQITKTNKTGFFDGVVQKRRIETTRGNSGVFISHETSLEHLSLSARHNNSSKETEVRYPL